MKAKAGGVSQAVLRRIKADRKSFQLSRIQTADNDNLFALTFSKKFTLPDLVVNDFSFDGARSVTEAFILIRESHLCIFFRRMDTFSGTGPDLLAIQVLLECLQKISLPLAKLIRRIIELGRWPIS